MDQALEQSAYRVEGNLSQQLRLLGQRMGSLEGGPRDVVQIHSAALKTKSNGALPQKAQAYSGEGRLMLVELMGYLVSYYQYLALGSSAKPETENVK